MSPWRDVFLAREPYDLGFNTNASLSTPPNPSRIRTTPPTSSPPLSANNPLARARRRRHGAGVRAHGAAGQQVLADIEKVCVCFAIGAPRACTPREPRRRTQTRRGAPRPCKHAPAHPAARRAVPYAAPSSAGPCAPPAQPRHVRVRAHTPDAHPPLRPWHRGRPWPLSQPHVPRAHPRRSSAPNPL